MGEEWYREQRRGMKNLVLLNCLHCKITLSVYLPYFAYADVNGISRTAKIDMD